MRRFTVLDNPEVEQKIDAHLQRIVEAIRSEMEPISIILRGSFGRNEGSVLIHDHEMRFLSDYEIDVVTFSPKYRLLLRRLSNQLTTELGVQTGLRWLRPDFLEKQKFGPFITGRVPVSISVFESRYGSQILYGQDIVSTQPEIDPASIRLESGTHLLLNRMAESMMFFPLKPSGDHRELEQYFWINKTILACAESLLLLWGNYHYSYKERCRRFANFASSKLDFLPDQARLLISKVERATEFKLRPNPDLYVDSVEDTWHHVIPVVDLVFRYLMHQIFDIEVLDYTSFPACYLEAITKKAGRIPFTNKAAQKLVEVYRSLRARNYPQGILDKYSLFHIVHSVVPLLFFNRSTRNCTEILTESRKWLKLLGPMNSLSADENIEKQYLIQRLTWFWKVYCHG